MNEQRTCGQGLAKHAALPSRCADVFAAVAENLELHLTALDATDKGSRPEFDAYVALAMQHRELASRLRALALQMEGSRDVPMAAHDMSVMTSPKTAEALERLVAEEESLASLLRESVEQYRQMLKDR